MSIAAPHTSNSDSKTENSSRSKNGPPLSVYNSSLPLRFIIDLKRSFRRDAETQRKTGSQRRRLFPGDHETRTSRPVPLAFAEAPKNATACDAGAST